MNITRYIFRPIQTDLASKMVVLGGPRQVGKTTLAQEFISSRDQYFNWDFLADRKVIKKHHIDPALRAIVLDEIHKYPRWRSLIKGLYDKYQASLKILVTGSACLDHFRKGGDSLFGRFFYYRLHPLSLGEIPKSIKNPLPRLLKFGGFPEPFLKGSEAFRRRWQKERTARVVYQDVRDLNNLKEIGQIELLADALPARVASPLSLASLAEDLQVSPNTVAKWVEILEQVYYCYRIKPFGPAPIRAVKKAQKLYLWDWPEVPSQGPCFENLVASQLLKFCHFEEDTGGHKMQLQYLKDVDGREIDFVVLKNRRPLFAVECKAGEGAISKHIHYFNKRTAIPHYYQVHLGSQAFKDRNIEVLPFETFCRKLKLP